MGIPLFDGGVATKAAKSAPLRFLHGAVVGIHAAYYITHLAELVHSALGGSPLAFGKKVEEEIRELKDAGVEMHFVFDGLDYGVKEDTLARSEDMNRLNTEAFDLYEAGQAIPAKKSFFLASSSMNANLEQTLMKTLHNLKIPFSVAPYSAVAQLAYYETHPSRFVDTIYGPSDLFCFGVDRIVTKFSLSTSRKLEADPSASLPTSEESSFDWVDRRTCLEILGTSSVPVFIDALMLAGPSLFLPKMFPPLIGKVGGLKYAVNELVSHGGSVARVCASYADPQLKEEYLDQYKRAMVNIKHHVVITAEGDVETMDKAKAPSDAHECIGLRLPEELYMYLSRGMIRPQVLNWLTYGTVYITAPLAGSDSELYRNLVSTQLDPLRRQAICLLTDSLFRYYQIKEITTKVWYDKENERKFTSRAVIPSPKESTCKWNVKDHLIQEAVTMNVLPGTLSFAVRSLSNAKYASKTIATKTKGDPPPLNSRNEVLVNAVWRFLHLRGYVDEQHNLTGWGKVLEAALATSGPTKDSDEAVFLAIELLRFNLVRGDAMFPDYSGPPKEGSETDKAYCMLVSRIACLGMVRHQPVAYSGALSRHILAYHSMASAVHHSLRNLLEMVVAAMFLEGSVDRDDNDWMDVSLNLPFYEERSCTLGSLTVQYLEDVNMFLKDGETAESACKEAREKGQLKWFTSSDFGASLDNAFHLWDAVYRGVKEAGELVEKREEWDKVDGWLSERR